MEPPEGLPDNQRAAWLLMRPGELSDGEIAEKVGVTDRCLRNWRAKWRALYGFSGLENRPEVVKEHSAVLVAGWTERRARVALEVGATVEQILGRVQELIPEVGTVKAVEDQVVHGPSGREIRELMTAVGIGVDKADQLAGIAPTNGPGVSIGVNLNLPPETKEALIEQERRFARDRQRRTAIEAVAADVDPS